MGSAADSALHWPQAIRDSQSRKQKCTGRINALAGQHVCRFFQERSEALTCHTEALQLRRLGPGAGFSGRLGTGERPKAALTNVGYTRLGRCLLLRSHVFLPLLLRGSWPQRSGSVWVLIIVASRDMRS